MKQYYKISILFVIFIITLIQNPIVSQKNVRIAIIGAGIAGISAAHILARAHEVTLFERSDRSRQN